jgi:tetratricopeptide (TPR) repeat protein
MKVRPGYRRYRGLFGGLAVAVVAAVALRAGSARAAEPPVDYQQKATAAYALGHYAEAAESFEKAFELAPDPALLYNAAQAYRLAGNKERALTLYENYLHVYGGQEKRAELESRIAELKKAIEHDKAVATQPPNGTEPVKAPGAPAASPGGVPSAQPPPADSSKPVLVNQPGGQATESRPLTSKLWFWGVVGGAVIAAVVIGVVVATGGSKDPSANLGTVNAN